MFGLVAFGKECREDRGCGFFWFRAFVRGGREEERGLLEVECAVVKDEIRFAEFEGTDVTDYLEVVGVLYFESQVLFGIHDVCIGV